MACVTHFCRLCFSWLFDWVPTWGCTQNLLCICLLLPCNSLKPDSTQIKLRVYPHFAFLNEARLHFSVHQISWICLSFHPVVWISLSEGILKSVDFCECRVFFVWKKLIRRFSSKLKCFPMCPPLPPVCAEEWKLTYLDLCQYLNVEQDKGNCSNCLVIKTIGFICFKQYFFKVDIF